jgi:D-sedoheptulose 7-phosphate isomerase
MESSVTSIIRAQLKRGIGVVEAVAADDAILATLAQAAQLTADAMKNGHKFLAAGNGGSAADAQHMVAEFVSRLCKDRPALRAIALTTDTSILTAIGNDYGYEHSFERQVEALGQPGDVFLGISTSGNSPNVVLALEQARKQGVVTVGLTGKGGGKMAPLCDYLISIPSPVTMYVQQAHLALEHIYCLLVEKAYFGEEFAQASIATTERV